MDLSTWSTPDSEPMAGANTTTTTDNAAADPLPPVDFQFTTVKALVDRVEAVPEDVDALTVAGVGPAQFAAVDKALMQRRKTRLFFLAEAKILIITIPNSQHEQLHASLYSWAMNTCDRGLLISEWRDHAAARSPRRSASASQGEGDSSGGPRQRNGEDAWPTLVIEAGYSQSLLSLRAKMRFWFHQSNHQVKIVVLAKAFPDDDETKRIVIEQWVEQVVAGTGTRSAHAGVLTRRAAAAAAASTPRLEPVCIQTINIVWAGPAAYTTAGIDQRMDPGSFAVARGPLRLDFARVFLRQPAGPGERDLVVSESELRMFASNVWL